MLAYRRALASRCSPLAFLASLPSHPSIPRPVPLHHDPTTNPNPPTRTRTHAQAQAHALQAPRPVLRAATAPDLRRAALPTSPPAPVAPTASSLPLPELLTIDEVAALLRTTRKAIYTLIRRGTLPGVVRLPRRLLVERAALVDWVHSCRAVSLTTQGDQR